MSFSAVENGESLSSVDPNERANALIAAASMFLSHLEHNKRLDAAIIRAVMEREFHGSDADGYWQWRDAYDAIEVAIVLFVQKYTSLLKQKADGAHGILPYLERIASLAPKQSRRSERSQILQQFSTPVGLSFVLAQAAQLNAEDIVLEPSAGNGLLAIHAEAAGCELVLNEICPYRRAVLERVFPEAEIFAADAEHIHDLLPEDIEPSIVLMNPPFSASIGVVGKRPEAIFDHLYTALLRLRKGGRIVILSQESFSPFSSTWREEFVRLQEIAQVSFTMQLDRRFFDPQGASVATRLTVIDKTPATDKTSFSPCAGLADDARDALWKVSAGVKGRARLVETTVSRPRKTTLSTEPALHALEAVDDVSNADPASTMELIRYDPKPRAAGETAKADTELYAPYEVQAISIPGAKAHPTPLVESSAMASVRPPTPSYYPALPNHLVESGTLSAAQLETIIYAGEAHETYLDGHFLIDEDGLQVQLLDEKRQDAVQMRRGFFCGDGTGVGKGRQIAGIILDHWNRNRRRAVWLSLAPDLIERARGDWEDLGGDRAQIFSLIKIKPADAIPYDEGIAFLSYPGLRSEGRDQTASRVKQLIDWLRPDFDGVIITDEAHAMSNAAGSSGERGAIKPSLQGLAGLRIQNLLPDARVVYFSATGAKDVSSLSYAPRLGIWNTEEFPFPSRQSFVSAMEDGGVGAMEVITRNLKELGLYNARSLSFKGIEYRKLIHKLTPEQRAIYDSYADAFEIIHNNLNEALKANGVCNKKKTYNRSAKSAARAAFEGAKFRFFGHLLTGLACPSLIEDIEKQLKQERACVIQLVSTGEALMERRLANIPQSEWDDLNVDVTPREYVLEYLASGFPTQLYKIASDADGNEHAVPVTDQHGNPVPSREALRLREEAIENLMMLPPVPGALDQLTHHFGADNIAEVTGRRRRIVLDKTGARPRYRVEHRSKRSNLEELNAFQEGEKRIMALSDAGGTGNDAHADRRRGNRWPREHYVVDFGMRADLAVQKLGRTNRSNQVEPPRYTLVTTDVKAQARFLSTIARRLDGLGAMTRGQRETGGQGLFRSEDNLESKYAADALKKFYYALARGSLSCCSINEFEEKSGLNLRDRDGGMRKHLPPIHTFLNRLLAFRIHLQDAVFEDWVRIIDGEVEQARADGTLDLGIETMIAERFEIKSEQTIYVHQRTKAESRAIEIEATHKISTRSLADAKALCKEYGGRLVVNSNSNRAAVMRPAPFFVTDAGAIIERSWLIRPQHKEIVSNDGLAEAKWTDATDAAFAIAWATELAKLPKYRTSTFFLVTGLLLPIWNELPKEHVMVRRVGTMDGRQFLGRVIKPENLTEILDRLGMTANVTMTDGDVSSAVMERGATAKLAGGLELRRVRVNGEQRIEVFGADQNQIALLKRLGCIAELPNYRFALYAPPGVLSKVIERFPVVSCNG